MAAGTRPQRRAIDNGPAFIPKALNAWAHANDVRLDCSRPGKPTATAFIEACNRRLRDECVRQHWVASLEEAHTTIEAWRVEYNTERPHGARGQQTPAALSAALARAEGERGTWTKNRVRTMLPGDSHGRWTPSRGQVTAFQQLAGELRRAS